ncbi:ASCH domain-containing protein [Intestinibacter bartlettii]|uniref:ASCH domain-containing protein n=1 Tax=Intestinibacter bartlettii TaxID=261299 RepID=UPI0008216CF4|nr:ASCH domain-containing protein [Intestinibacter bartlettii]SCI46507.1 Uncharacterized conserved protein [uncultured Clostridium sp.]
MKAILSIKPQFVDKIFNGEKKFEYRKKIFKKEIESVIIYSTKPVGKFVGEFKVRNIINDEPIKVWNETNLLSGINYEYYKSYFHNHKTAYALEIEDLVIYDNPIVPNKDFTPPQSFCYCNNEFLTI